MAHYDIFRDQLGIKYPALGHALWEPNPGSLYPPVEVGDVGYIREGKFHWLFNALLPADHPSHQRFGVPEHHEPLRPGVGVHHVNSGVLIPNDFCSYGVTMASGGLDVFATEPIGSADVSFYCARKCGAVLSLPVTAQRKDTIARGDFAKWIIRHIDTWFAFTRRLGLGIDQMEDMVLVTGRDRTKSWTNVAFFEDRADAQVSFGVQVTGDVGASVNWQVSRRHIQGAMMNQGPSGGGLPEDQCIFVRGFRVTRAFKLFPRLRGAAGHTQDPSEHDREPDLEVESIPSFAKYRDPLHVLSEYIAERAPECDFVLVHDDDLDRLRRIGDGTSLEAFQTGAIVGCLQRSEPEIALLVYDTSSAENNAPRTDTGGSTVALFSEELRSWARTTSPVRLPASLTQRSTELDSARLANPSQTLRHRGYFIHDGDVTFRVENYMFRVHKYFLTRESAFFRRLLTPSPIHVQNPPGSLESNPIVLDAPYITSEVFARFLWVFYNPKYSVYDATLDQWSSILYLAQKWGFKDVEHLCVRELEKLDLSPVNRIDIYQRFGLEPALLLDSYASLVTREYPIGLEEGLKLGLQTSLQIAVAREKARSPNTGVGPRSPSAAQLAGPDLHDLLSDIFGLPKILANERTKCPHARTTHCPP